MEIIFSFNDIYTHWNNGLERIDDDRIIVCNSWKSLIVISISKLEIIKEIKIDYTCYSIKSFKNKKIFLVGGHDQMIEENIYIYIKDDYEFINVYKLAYHGMITGFIELTYNFISYSIDKTIKFWELE